MTAINERTETAKITVLAMGSAIPDWLVVADPVEPGAPKGAWRFDCDVVIIELVSDFFVMPIIPLGQMSTCSIMDWTGMAGHNVYAASKPVRVIHQCNHIFPIEWTAAVQAQREAAAQQQSTNFEVHPARPSTVTPRPGLRAWLARLWYG